MRSTLLAFLCASVLVFPALPLYSQTCTTPNTSNTVITVSGDGCGPYSAEPCQMSQPVVLRVETYLYTGNCINSVNWNFGDGTPTSTVTSSPYTIAHSYAAPGNFTVTATVTHATGTLAIQRVVPITGGAFRMKESSLTVAESDGKAVVTVMRNAAPMASTVDYATADQTARAGQRYIAKSGTLSFAAGETSKTIEITLIDDKNFSSSETFRVNLSNPSAGFQLASTGPSATVITLAEDDQPPTLACSPLAPVAREGSTSPITIVRTGDMSRTVQLRYRVDPWSTNGTSGTLVFNPNETSKSFNVTVIDDDVYTGDRSTSILFDALDGAVFRASETYPPSTSASVTLKIVDDEPVPTLQIDDVAVAEGQSGTTTANFQVKLSAPLNSQLSIFAQVTSATARAGSDFTGTSNWIHLNSGETSVKFPISVRGDTEVETNEVLYVDITITTCCGVLPVVSKARGTLTILNDDIGLGPSNLTLTKGESAILLLRLGQPAGTSETAEITTTQSGIVTVPSSISIPSNADTIRIDVKALAVGTTSVRVALPAAHGGRTLSSNVTVFEPLTLNFSPDTIEVPVGATMRIGASLDPPQGSPTQITLGGFDASVIDLPTSIIVPPGGTAFFEVKGLKKGSSTITATLPAANGSMTSSLVAMVIDAPTLPAITHLVPPTGPSSGGTTVAVSGFNLSADCTMAFDGIAATNLQFVSPTSMTATTPGHAAGSVTVTLTCRAGSASLANGFTYLAAAPSITSIAPGFGSTSGGTIIRLTGTNLQPNCGLWLDGSPARGLSILSSTQMQALTPAHAEGTVSAAIRCGVQTASLSNAFTYSSADDPAASIAGIDPLFGAPGQHVVITGTRFRMSDRISFGNAPAVIIKTSPDTHTVRIPDLPLGKVAVNLTDSNGRLTTTGPIFTILEPVTPQITTATPTDVHPGAELHLQGRGFRSSYAISIGDRIASVAALSFAEMTIRVPQIAPGSYPIHVLNSSGGLVAIGPVVVVRAEGPAVSNISPACGSSDGGTELIISGTGLSSDTTVTFAGARATRVTWVDDKTLRVTTPMAAPGSAIVQVSNAKGTSTFTGGFTYFAPSEPDPSCAVPSRGRPTRR